ncbi:glycoside hydrolase family 43 protein [Nocardioides sp. YIM 152588]|uniref:glycoside hydrolase family 43 protein n=1 Tax=Nocardioides sp. YIM 152588 TaxID=3158259 RepID=UPI0032E3A7B7
MAAAALARGAARRLGLGGARTRSGLRHGHPAIGDPSPTVPAGDPRSPLPAGWFVNPVAEGADPYLVRDGDRYLWCQTEGDRGVAVGVSRSATRVGDRRVVWRAPADGPTSAEVWAPELVRLDGRWHIYLAASDGHDRTHRAYVLVADTDDPQGAYTLHGPLSTGDAGGPAQWAIDMTVLEVAGRRYALWSGWPDDEHPVQHLYAAALASPTELAGPRVMISAPTDHAWERIHPDDPASAGINEGPQVLRRGGRTFVLFSASSALRASYTMGMLELVGDDPLDPAAWRKHPAPLLTSTPLALGVGHGTVVDSPDGTEWWLAFHRKIAADVSFRRVVHLRPVGWTATGEPVLDPPIAAGVPLPLPSGTAPRAVSGPVELRYPGPAGARADLEYYGHQQLLAEDGEGVHLGRVPRRPVNAFRSGEKLVLRDGDHADLRVTASLRVHHRGTAGLLVRATAPAVGPQAQRGYLVAWRARGSVLTISRTDGATRTVLGSLRVPRPRGGVVELEVVAAGDTITARLAGAELAVTDGLYPSGSVGVQVLRGEATLTALAVTPLPGG